MINKKKLLGKEPELIGDKDAVHVAIISVRAGSSIESGEWCKLNEFNEAVPCNRESAVGVADPWRKGVINTGSLLWLLPNPDSIANVAHTWDHPDFANVEPTREIQRNKYLEEYATTLGLTYNQLIKHCSNYVQNKTPILYDGSLSEEELDNVIDEWRYDFYDMWNEWAAEARYEFYNVGSECCPEYEYPDINHMFKFQGRSV